jgi:hypothetical protein
VRKIDFSGYRLSSGIADGQSIVTRVKRGLSYGHVVRTTRYYQLYPVDITVTSSLDDTKQLKFKNDQQEWQWQLHLSPFHSDMEKTELLECLSATCRNRDKVTVQVSEGDTGRFELPLRID